MRERGTIVNWFPHLGYGFIKPDLVASGGADVFLHEKQIRSGFPRTGAIVEFEAVVRGARKRLVADRAEVVL